MDSGLDRALRGADRPRELPAAFRAELESMLLSSAWQEVGAGASLIDAMDLETAFAGIDGPRPLPSAVRARLSRTLRTRRAPRLQRGLGAAATVLLFASVSLAVVRSGPPDERTPGVASDAGAPAASDGIAFDERADADAIAGGGVAAPRERAGVPPIPPPLPGGAGRGPAPPFAFSASVPLERADASGAGAAAADGPPFTIGIVRGDEATERGFERYVQLLNETGGIRGRPFVLTEVSEGDPAGPQVIATVNLSGAALSGAGAPSWTRGPLLEGTWATEAMLDGRVHGFGSPPERQAHLIAHAMYPSAVREPTTAVIYHGSGPIFGQAVADAIARVLVARGVTPVRVAYRTDGGANLFLPADVAFLSMSTQAAARWFDQSRQAEYDPSRGIAGIQTLMEPALGPAMEGRQVSILSPYSRPDSPETASEAFGGDADTYSVGHVHGWVTAKNLAVAVWRHPADSPAAMRAALEGLAGYASGFAPPFEVRPGTNARTPEGMVFGFEHGGFVPRSGFLRDPF